MRKILVLLLVLTAAAAAAAQEEQLFREAERRYSAGDYRFALSRYQTLIEEYPRSAHIADAHYRQAVIYYRLGEPERALEGLRRVEERYAYTRFFRYLPFWRGLIRFDLGEYEKAAEQLGLYLQENEDGYRREALLYKALSHRELGEQSSALEAAKRALEAAETPEEVPQVLELYASLLVREGRHQELYALFGDLELGQLPEESARRLSLYRAEALFQQERYGEAETVYRRLLEDSGEVQRIAYKRLFVLYQRTGQEEKREEIFDAAQSTLAGKPELLHEFLLRVGIESYKKERYDLAESYLRRIWRAAGREQVDDLVPLYLARILEIKDEHRRAAEMLEGYLPQAEKRREEILFALGRIYSGHGQWERGAEHLSRLFAEYPRTRHERKGSYLLAFCRYKSGESRRALTVIEELFRTGEEGELYGELLRLKSRLHLRLGETGKALDTLNEYLPLHPADSGAHVDLARIRFSRKEYRKVLEAVRRFDAELPEVPSASGAHYTLIRYMEGLSRLALGESGEAAEVLEELRDGTGAQEVYRGIAPHLLFYLGWAYYEQGDLETARERFTELINRYPEHSRTPGAQYYAGWAAYAAGDYSAAAGFFAGYGKNAETERERDRGSFMHAQSLAADGKREDALVVYRSLFRDSPDSAFADEALFEYASQLEKGGESERAAESYYLLYRRYPTSPLAEEALYSRAEVFYDLERWEKARNAFYEHRSSFSSGELLPLSLYWGGKAAEQNGEPYGAALLWEKLVEEYPGSSLHRDALAELAALYAGQGEYEKALQHYTRLSSLYPEKAAEVDAASRIETLKRVLNGESEREARLQVTYEQQGLSTGEGRRAALELAKMYLYRYGEQEERARTILQRLAEKAPDSESGARALYYLGEYRVKRGDWEEAARSFFDAALAGSGDNDFIARSMYRAAESAAQAGDRSGARRMVDKLESEFPDSQWAREGRKLIRRLEQQEGGR